MINGIAFDRASVRTIDVDGRLHVATSHLTMEQVADYIGSEIPGWQELGLDPHRVYSLYRPAAEIEKAASSFNKIPVLSQHVPVTADNPRPELVMGTTGEQAEFHAPYLDNSLVIWSQEGIDLIESGRAKQLSCAYRYTPVLKRGTFNGQPYDIVMTDLKANHVALVATGRAGPTVVVGDSLPKELLMKKSPPSRTAILARGALLALSPIMATDSKPVIDRALAGVTAANWTERKPKILAALKPKMATDADVGTLHKLLDGLDGEAKDEEDMPQGDPGDGGDPNATLDAVDADPCADILAMLQGKLAPEDMAAVEAKLRAALAPPAKDGEEPAGPIQHTPGTPAAPGTGPGNLVTKTAMDAALKRQADELRAQGKATAAALQFVRPWVGELLAQDSAIEVYRSALRVLGVTPADDWTEGACKALIQAKPKAGQVQPRAHVAMDTAQTETVTTKFPHLARIKVAG